MSFSTLVRSARDQGYTEPDPREDLTGMDVARKLLILARETGLALEMKDIEVESLLPKGSDKHKTVDDFLDYLAQFDEPMSTRLETVQKAGKVLRYIGSIEGGKAKVSLQEVGLKHPFYSLSGSDNIIAFRSRRYDAQPLVIKGAGAGAGVTGAGVFGDILSCCRNQNNE
jgi:aspartokinase/homoserine dehydrogenase 1